MNVNYSSEELLGKYLAPEDIDLYLAEVRQANKRFNLYSRGLTLDDLRLLVAESLIPIEAGWMKGNIPSIDIGSGWGIPAVPMLLAHSSLDITLLERSDKKAGFLRLTLHKLNSAVSGSKYRVIKDDLESFKPANEYGQIILRQISLNDRLWRHIQRIILPEADIIYFGSRLPDHLVDSAHIISYAVDNSPTKKMTKVRVFQKK